jgi:hypothetical protein
MKYLFLEQAIRDYWIDAEATEVVQDRIADYNDSHRTPFLTPHKDYGKPPVNLDRESWFDSMGNYWDDRTSSTDRLFQEVAQFTL